MAGHSPSALFMVPSTMASSPGLSDKCFTLKQCMAEYSSSMNGVPDKKKEKKRKNVQLNKPDFCDPAVLVVIFNIFIGMFLCNVAMQIISMMFFLFIFLEG